MKAANLSGVKHWNCWVTQSLGVWLRHLWPVVIADKKKKKQLAPLLTPGITVCARGNITVVERFRRLPKCTVSITCTRHCIFQPDVQWTVQHLLSSSLFKLSSHRRQNRSLISIQNLMNVNDVLTRQEYVCDSPVFILSFFRVEWAEKDFLGWLGQRELRWMPTCDFLFYLYKNIDSIIVKQNDCLSLAGRARYCRKCWTHGRKSKKPTDVTASIFSQCLSIHPSNTESVNFRAWWVSSDLWERQDWRGRR